MDHVRIAEERLARDQQIPEEMAVGNYSGVQEFLDYEFWLTNEAISYARTQLAGKLPDDEHYRELQEKIDRGRKIQEGLKSQEDKAWAAVIVGEYERNLSYTRRASHQRVIDGSLTYLERSQGLQSQISTEHK